jgi:hypothetical protein
LKNTHLLRFPAGYAERWLASLKNKVIYMHGAK